jgi:hypothetical protein
MLAPLYSHVARQPAHARAHPTVLVAPAHPFAVACPCARREDDDKFGFLVMDGNGSLYGTLSGNSREILHKFSVDLPKKHGRGGQSALRFARLRLEKRQNYVRKVAEIAVQMFITDDRCNVSGLILAGSADFKNALQQNDHWDPRLAAKVLKVVDVSYGARDDGRCGGSKRALVLPCALCDGCSARCAMSALPCVDRIAPDPAERSTAARPADSLASEPPSTPYPPPHRAAPPPLRAAPRLCAGGENGFNQAIELSAEVLSNVKFIKEKKLISVYFEQISQVRAQYRRAHEQMLAD